MLTHTDVTVAGIVEAMIKAAKELRRQGHEGRIIGSGISIDPDFALKIGPEGNGTVYAARFWWDRGDGSRAFVAKFN